MVAIFLALSFLPAVAWYYASIPLVSGGMKYGRNTLLFVFTLLGLRSVDSSFNAAAEHIALYVLLFVACCDALYALLMQWGDARPVVAQVYGLLARCMPLVTAALFIPTARFIEAGHYADKPFFILMYAANTASVVHNAKPVNKYPVLRLLMILLSLGMMAFAMFLFAFEGFTLPLS